MLTESIAGRWRLLQHALRPPDPGDPFHCRIRSIEFCGRTRARLLAVPPFNSREPFRLWPHAPTARFVGTPLPRADHSCARLRPC
jgi:hypothetical protein